LKTFFNNFFTASKGEVGASILNVISLMILARALGIEKFGIYVLFYSYHDVLNRIFNFQTWQAYIKFGTEVLDGKEPERIKSLFTACFLIDAASMILSAIVAVVGSKYFIYAFSIDNEYLFLLQMISFSIIFYAAEMYIGVLRIFNEYALQAKVQISIACARLLLFIFTYLFYPSLEGFVYATIFSALIGLGLKSIAAYSVMKSKTASIDLSGSYRYKSWKRLAGFIFYNNLDVTVRMITRQIDVLVLGRLFSIEVVGAYKLAVHIGSIFGKLAHPIFQVFYPELTRLFSQNKNILAKEFAVKICSYLLVFMLFCYFCYFMFGKYLILNVFGESYESTFYIGLLYLASIVIAVSVTPMSSITMAKGLVKKAFYNQVIVTALFLIVFGLTVRPLGAYSAGLAHIVFNLSWACLTIYTIKKHKVFSYGN